MKLANPFSQDTRNLFLVDCHKKRHKDETLKQI
jgi:hypothetical protein